jgi:hypothetical protein
VKTRAFRSTLCIVLILCLCCPLVTEHVCASDVKSVVASTKGEYASEQEKTEEKAEEEKNTSKRERILEKTRNSTTYLLQDGSKEMVLYGGDVRYEDEKGKLTDYEPSLVTISKEEKVKDKELEGYEYQNKKGDTKHYLPENLTKETPLLLKKDSYEIQVRPVFAEEKLKALPIKEEAVSNSNEDVARKAFPEEKLEIDEILQEVDPASLPEEKQMKNSQISSETMVDIYDKTKTIPLKMVYSNEAENMELEYIS